MRPHRLVLAALASMLAAVPASAQAPSTGLVQEVATDIGQMRRKLVALAQAMPDSTYAWRPGAGVRSVGEVFKHVASDNYLLPGIAGATIPSATGIKADDFKTVAAYEQRGLGKAEIVAELEASFDFLAQAMAGEREDQLGAPLQVFGRPVTRRAFWILTTTHLHEHLGQAIAYARSNGVKPPWSQ